MAHPPSARAAATHKTHEMRRRARTVTLRNPTPDPITTRDAPTTAGDVDMDTTRHRSRLDAYPPPRRAPRRADEATTWAWPVWDPSTGHDSSTCPKKIQSEKLRKSRAVSADGPTAVGTRARGRARRRDARARAREGREGRETFFASSFVVVRRGSIAVRLSRPRHIASHRDAPVA